jgi:hypothetical protein
MPVIQTGPDASGGVGTATAANQATQISIAQSTENRLQDNYDGGSVFKNDNDDGGSVFKIPNGQSVFKNSLNDPVFLDGDTSVFKDDINRPVFLDGFTKSVFKTNNGQSILKKSKISDNLTSVQSFANTTPATLASDIQTWLRSNIVVIIQIVYADAGGLAPNPHTALIIYNNP